MKAIFGSLLTLSLFSISEAWSNHIPVKKTSMIFRSSPTGNTPERPPSFMEVGETQFLDKAGFIKERSDSQLSFQREAELQHGRVAMLSIVILQYLDNVDKSTLAINQVSSLPLTGQVGLLVAFGYLEFIRLKQFEDFRQDGDLFTMRKDAIPGNPFNTKSSRFLQNAELNNGRLAMFGALGYMAQELATQIPPI